MNHIQQFEEKLTACNHTEYKTSLHVRKVKKGKRPGKMTRYSRSDDSAGKEVIIGWLDKVSGDIYPPGSDTIIGNINSSKTLYGIACINSDGSIATTDKEIAINLTCGSIVEPQISPPVVALKVSERINAIADQAIRSIQLAACALYEASQKHATGDTEERDVALVCAKHTMEIAQSEMLAMAFMNSDLTSEAMDEIIETYRFAHGEMADEEMPNDKIPSVDGISK